MAEPFLAEIRIMSFVFAPKGWAQCGGQQLPIQQNSALFAMMGTTYGGNGSTTFALPDLRGRVPIHTGASHTLGERAGEQAHTVTMAELPQHMHFLNATTSAGQKTPSTTTMLAASNPQPVYGPSNNLVAMNPQAVANTGGSQAHLNMQPYLVLNFCIALQGIFPNQY